MDASQKMEAAQRLIEVVCGDRNGDGMTVTDMGIGYASRSNGTDDQPWVLGDWNDITRYVNGEREVISTAPGRLFDALERLGVEGEWLDEWSPCAECYRLIRTSPNSYSWTLEAASTEDGYVCERCALEDPETYLEDYINQPNKAVTWMNRDGLESAGFIRYEQDNEHDYAAGWHPGQTDEPPVILDEILAKYPTVDVVFFIDSVGQFSTYFGAFYRIPESDDQIEGAL